MKKPDDDQMFYVKAIGGVIVAIVVIIVLRKLFETITSGFGVGGIFETDSARSKDSFKNLKKPILPKISNTTANGLAQDIFNRLDGYTSELDYVYINGILTSKKLSFSDKLLILKKFGIRKGEDLRTFLVNEYGSNPYKSKLLVTVSKFYK